MRSFLLRKCGGDLKDGDDLGLRISREIQMDSLLIGGPSGNVACRLVVYGLATFPTGCATRLSLRATLKVFCKGSIRLEGMRFSATT